MNSELSQIDALGDEAKGAFRTRVAKFESREKKRRAAAMNGEKDEAAVEKWHDYKIVEKQTQTTRVASFVLEAVDPDAAGNKESQKKPPLLGAHARVKLPSGLVRTYSVVDGTESRFQLGIALADPGRGGSAHLHRVARVGDVLQVGRITADLKPAAAASNHVFIAGGIGVTAFLRLVEAAHAINWQATLHWGVRSAEDDLPFRERVAALGVLDVASDGEGGKGEEKEGEGEHKVVRLYDASRGQRMDITRIFKALPWNSHVYVCGPRRMMDEARREATACGLGEDEVHFEAFEADTSGDPFEVEVDIAAGEDGGKKGSEKRLVLKVGEEETLLEVLKRELGDDDVPSSCEVGNCGTCKVVLKSGLVDHRGTALMEDEKRDSMLACASRGIGRIVIEV